MGIINDAWEMTVRDAVPWDTLSASKKDEMDLRMSIYAAQIDRMDQNIGKLVDALRDLGELDDTLMFFLSDNGGCAEGGMLGRGPLEILMTKKGYSQSYGQAWANASNTPFRKYKHWVHEGGIASPLIVHWARRRFGEGGTPHSVHTLDRPYGNGTRCGRGDLSRRVWRKQDRSAGGRLDGSGV